MTGNGRRRFNTVIKTNVAIEALASPRSFETEAMTSRNGMGDPSRVARYIVETRRPSHSTRSDCR